MKTKPRGIWANFRTDCPCGSELTITNARRKLTTVATYEPTSEALAYREQYGHIIAQQPAPTYGGRDGLRMAADEAALVEARKREAA